jgi:hypothetical protein
MYPGSPWDSEERHGRIRRTHLSYFCHRDGEGRIMVAHNTNPMTDGRSQSGMAMADSWGSPENAWFVRWSVAHMREQQPKQR